MTTTAAADNLSKFDLILIYATDAVHTAEQAETNARRALAIASEGTDCEMEYAARCALVAAMGAASTARATLRKLCEFGMAQLESELQAEKASA